MRGRCIHRSVACFRKGVTLVELLVTVGVIALLSVPLFSSLTMSRKMGVSAMERNLAMNLAGSYIDSVAGLRASELQVFDSTPDAQLKGPLSLESLELIAAPKGFFRTVMIEELPSDNQRLRVFHISVVVEWEKRGTNHLLSYELNRLLTYYK